MRQHDQTGPADGPPPPLPGSPLSLRRQLIFWAGALLVFIALLWLLGDVLLPFVAGMVLAYLLDPLVRQAAAAGPQPCRSHRCIVS